MLVNSYFPMHFLAVPFAAPYIPTGHGTHQSEQWKKFAPAFDRMSAFELNRHEAL